MIKIWLQYSLEINYLRVLKLLLNYAGHQFGHFTILGDGRALIFEHLTKNNKRFDINLKGSGKTPYSRGADGKVL